MNYLKITFGVLIVLSASRLIPHPPNFTSLLALSFYIPAVFGVKFIPVVILALLFTDVIIGFHSTMFFTAGSVIIIGMISKFFNRTNTLLKVIRLNLVHNEKIFRGFFAYVFKI